MILVSISCRMKMNFHLRMQRRIPRTEKSEKLVAVERMKTRRRRKVEIGKKIIRTVISLPAIDLLLLNFISETSHIRQHPRTYLIFSLVIMGKIMYWNAIFLRNELRASLVGLVLLLYRKVVPVKFLTLVESAKLTAVY